MALACRPPLTTIDMDLSEIGRIAALRLLEAIDADAETETGTEDDAGDGEEPGRGGVHTVPCRLVVRESS
jgi:LacI family transcriptional regulator